MHFEYCPTCGSRLQPKPAGDEGLVPFCPVCQRYWFDFFYSCIIILLCNEYDEVVLCKQPHLSQKYESITSGFIMPGETAEETAHREVKEELGLTLEKMIPEGTYWFSKGQMLMHGYPKVPMDRFDGKKVIECKVADGINKAEQLLNRAVAGDAPVYHAAEGSRKEEKAEGGSTAHMIYTHLMSGVSHMLPFVIGGGIMTAIAFLIDTLLGYGATGGSAFGSCTPLSAFFKYAGGLAMGLMVPVLAGYIAYSIADRPGLAVGFTGGLLASSGNALITGYNWADSTTGFQKFIADFAFQGANGGNTVSGFLGGILAGFLAGFIVLFLKKAFSKLPASLDGIKPTLIYPLLGILIISILMCFIFNPLIGLINTGLSNGLTAISDAGYITVLGLILGAMMAIDMGGPINKAAYVFGTGVLATASQMLEKGAQPGDPAVQACYIAMAAIMVGGMVPPIGIALACQFFPKKFTKEERGSKVSNFVMGASFITEGAIPFAAADPLHVIPCTLVGAGVAGFLSALFKCTLMAPHGGIFVFATVGHPLLYILAWAVGSVITAVMLGVIKKDAA